MSMVRMNITIPEDLAKQLEKAVGNRKKSLFISEALKERIERIEHEKLQKELEEGYAMRRDEAIAITREYEPIDGEGWDEY